MLITFINEHYLGIINKTQVLNYDLDFHITKYTHVESETTESLYSCYCEIHDTPNYFCISPFLDKAFKCAQRIEIN